jgi:hypothetical protein
VTSRPPSPASLPRALLRRGRAVRASREERRFRTRLRFDPRAPTLVLSPHWDDAVLDCWSVLAGAGEVRVVNVFAGVPVPGALAPWDAITGALDSAQRAHERIAEDARALAHAGRGAVGLAFLDAQYRHATPAPGLDELDRALAAHVACVSRVYAPAGIGAHADHLLVRRYGRMLARTRIPVALYADLPYCVLHGWPPWVDGAQADPHRDVDAFWRPFLAGVPELPPLRSGRVVRLDGDAAAAKLAAVREYETQLACLDYGGGRILSDPAIHRFEVYWDLR